MIEMFLFDDTIITPVGHIPKVIVFEGDSLSDVNFSPSLINASEKIVLTGWATSDDDVYNVATGGERAEQSITQFSTQILPKYNPSKYNMVVYWVNCMSHEFRSGSISI